MIRRSNCVRSGRIRPDGFATSTNPAQQVGGGHQAGREERLREATTLASQTKRSGTYVELFLLVEHRDGPAGDPAAEPGTMSGKPARSSTFPAARWVWSGV